MRKLVYALLCFVLFGCTQKEQISITQTSSSPINSSTFNESDFSYTIEVLDDVYFTEGDEIKIQASLIYDGDLDEITITHAASPFYYEVEELTRGFTIDYPMNQPLMMTIMKKGEPLTSTYRVSGGYSDQDSKDYITFMKQFLSGSFPSGTYAVHGYAKFTVKGESEEKKLPATIVFQVESK